MSSKFEQIIDELDVYIESCKFQPFTSNAKIIVDKERIDDLIRNLRMKTPKEIRDYQKIINNREAILNEARVKAEDLIKRATVQTNELVNEHEIMQQAYAQANEVIDIASQKAQGALDEAVMEANRMKSGAVQYTDQLLADLENIVTQMISMTTAHYESFINNMNGYAEMIRANRAELYPKVAEELLEEGQALAGESEE